MRFPFSKICWVAVVCCSAILLSGCGQTPAQQFNISGTLTNHDGQRVTGVVMILKYDNYEREAPVNDGAFFFPDVEPGTVTAYLKVRPRPIGPPLPPNATAEEKRQYQEAYGKAPEPVTANIPRGYYYLANSKLRLEIKPEGPHRFELKLEKI